MPHAHILDTRWSRLCGISLLCLTPWLPASAEPSHHHAHPTVSDHSRYQDFKDWQRQHINQTPVRKAKQKPFRGKLTADRIKLKFGPPPKQRVGNLKLKKTAAAAFKTTVVQQFGPITLDGELNDWSAANQINLPDSLALPPYLAPGDVLYGQYVDAPEPAYVIAIHAKTRTIGPNTTLWLNTDQDATTGHRIWGQFGGAEYFVNVFHDSSPHLYDAALDWVKGPLAYAYNADKSVLELAIPLSDLSPSVSTEGLDVIADINNTVFLPAYYDSGEQYTIVKSTDSLPPRTDFSKRIGIVYSDTSKDHFFGDKAYSQLFMAVQHQAMMAGIPFDLLNESDLTQISNLVNYDALIFPSAANIPDAIRNPVYDTLFKAIYHYKIGVITAGDWLTNNETGASITGDAYRYMKQLIGIGRVDGEGPVDIALKAADIHHPAMQGYASNETILSSASNWFSYYQPVPGQTTSGLAAQMVTGSMAGTYDAVLASTTGGRNVHFATLGYMGDTNLLWQALQWVVYGTDTSIGLKMGRENNLFVARNDMDQAMEHYEVAQTHVPLLNLLQHWKEDYGFVGSYYIDIGNDPAGGQWTDWAISAPLFQNYIALGNEIGTHSWTHPHFTNQLSNAQIEFEFNQSMNEIINRIGPTWNGQAIRGGAVPGAPENTSTGENISQYLDYLSGGFSGPGAGFQSAFGYLKPNANKVYFSPNMAFDFTLIEFGVPIGNPPVPMPLSAVEAEQYWQDQYATLMKHASQPIIHWPWHDYGPTTSAHPITGDGYTVAMFENTIATAADDRSEFATSADVAQRISALRDASLTVTNTGSSMTAEVHAGHGNMGTFALEVDAKNQVIQRVDGWYAYDKERIFLDQDGGTYPIHLGTAPDAVTHITYIPSRSRLISLNGDGHNLSYSIEGEGCLTVWLDHASAYTFTGADEVEMVNDHEVKLHHYSYGTHNVTIVPQ